MHIDSRTLLGYITCDSSARASSAPSDTVSPPFCPSPSVLTKNMNIIYAAMSRM